MCSRILVLTAALLLAPPGAKAGDLIVWWDEGYYAEESGGVIVKVEPASGVLWTVTSARRWLPRRCPEVRAWR